MIADSPRPPARRGKARSLQREETRARLIDATVELLRANSLMELAATDIAGRAGLSNAAFYVYFRDVYDAVLAACAHAEQVSPICSPCWNARGRCSTIMAISRPAGTRTTARRWCTLFCPRWAFGADAAMPLPAYDIQSVVIDG